MSGGGSSTTKSAASMGGRIGELRLIAPTGGGVGKRAGNRGGGSARGAVRKSETRKELVRDERQDGKDWSKVKWQETSRGKQMQRRLTKCDKDKCTRFGVSCRKCREWIPTGIRAVHVYPACWTDEKLVVGIHIGGAGGVFEGGAQWRERERFVVDIEEDRPG